MFLLLWFLGSFSATIMRKTHIRSSQPDPHTKRRLLVVILGCSGAYVFTFVASGLILCYHDADNAKTFFPWVTERPS